jgi:ribosomal protein S18 acetylase RimI-like enzyme
MDIKIRNMTQQDVPQAAKVFFEAFNSVGEKWTLEFCIKRIEQYFDPQTCWVAEDAEKIVGMITSKIDNVTDHQELYIDILAVTPATHNSGVGSNLLQIAEDYAKIHGLGGMWLSAGMELPSYGWYRKLGFKESKWRALYKLF